MKTDTELLDWLSTDGYGHALVSDDNGHWACVCDGMQTVPLSEDPEDISTSFWIEKERWRDTVRDAIEDAIKRSGA